MSVLSLRGGVDVSEWVALDYGLIRVVTKFVTVLCWAPWSQMFLGDCRFGIGSIHSTKPLASVVLAVPACLGWVRSRAILRNGMVVEPGPLSE